jgi:DNA polymerase-3 subunit alpha
MNEWLDRGWRFRRVDRINKYDQRRYSERIRYEKQLIASKDYCDYFLVVADVVSWAKDNGIVVGPARGSAAASLVCWLLRITEVNPMDFPDLVFERFIDVSRDDLPDIDLDFDSDRRSEIREYLVGKYGAEHVGTIGTFITYKPRLALDDVRRVYKESIPMGYVEKIKKMVIERSPNDLRATDCIADTAELFPNVKAIFDLYPDLEVAKKLEGNIKQMGIHAAGLVVSPVPITEVCAIYSNREGVEVISMDKYDAERQGLLKIDVLGLKTMSVIAEMMRDLGVSIDQLYGLPLDDEDVLAGFTANDVIGIFQFEGDATRELTGAIKPDTFTELYAINALSRPGPLHSGAAREYTDVKNGDKKLRLLHPIFDNIVSSTYGQVVYQEQIIRIAREIGGFDEAEASYIRKIISRKLGEQEFERQWSRFWGGAEKVGMTEDVARLIWNMCITSGVYAFNAAHAVSYTIIAYWMMWFKVNSPASFYSASLNYCGPDRTYPLMRDAERHGIYVSPPDYGRGSMRWAGYGDELIGGFQSLHGIGQVMGSAMEAFANERAEAPTSWDDYLQVKGVGPKTIAKLKNFEASDDPYNIHYIDNRVARALEELEKLDPDKKIPRPTHTSATLPTDRSGPDIPVVWAGIVGGINMRNLVDSARARGIEHDPDLVRDPELDEWVVLYASDGDDTVSLNVNRWRYPALRSAIHNITSGRDVVIFEAVKSSNMNSRYLKVKNLWVIDLEDE